VMARTSGVSGIATSAMVSMGVVVMVLPPWLNRCP
jgi:hypothetical protein